MDNGRMTLWQNSLLEATFLRRSRVLGRLTWSCTSLLLSFSLTSVFRDFHNHFPSASPSPAAAFFFCFFVSLSFLVSSSLRSSSSSSFSVRTSSGLYHTGGCASNEGPPGSRAIVKWNAPTNVFGGVYLYLPINLQHSTLREEGRNAHNFIGLDQTMLYGLLQSHTCTLLILKHTHIKWEWARFFLHL